MAKTRNTAALHFTPSPVLLGVLRAHARLLAGGGPAQVGHVVEGLARGALAPLAADLWQEADRLALCRQREGVAPAAIALEVETLLVGRLAATRGPETEMHITASGSVMLCGRLASEPDIAYTGTEFWATAERCGERICEVCKRSAIGVRDVAAASAPPREERRVRPKRGSRR